MYKDVQRDFLEGIALYSRFRKQLSPFSVTIMGVHRIRSAEKTVDRTIETERQDFARRLLYCSTSRDKCWESRFSTITSVLNQFEAGVSSRKVMGAQKDSLDRHTKRASRLIFNSALTPNNMM
jgi:hypothetical protein